MRSHLQGCGLKLQAVKSHHAMADAMKATAKAMYKMNKAVDVPAITKMMAEFEKENAKTEIMQEIMGDTLDDALADESTEEAEEQVVNQVLDEIGKLQFFYLYNQNILHSNSIASRHFFWRGITRGSYGNTCSGGKNGTREDSG